MIGCSADPGACSGHGCGGRSGPVALTLTRRPTGPAEPPPWYHVVPDGNRAVVLVVGSSEVYQVDPDLGDRLARGDPTSVAELSAVSGRRDSGGPMSVADPAALPALRSLSLNVAQLCNPACTYCYADHGRFHARPRRMAWPVAQRAVRDLIDGVTAGDRVTIGFIGGEPLLNRPVVHRTVRYVTAITRAAGVRVGFSITTNGTLVQADDIALFRRYPFAVTVSLDGDRATNDRNRPTRNGSGSWTTAMKRLAPLLARPGTCALVARATVTRDALDIPGRVAALLAAGFPEVGVSPARTGPDPDVLLRPDDWPRYLDGLTAAADGELTRLRRRGGRGGIRFGNLATAMREIHRGTARPLPCGAAYGYASVDVDGAYSTCHRTVGDPRWSLGSEGALDDTARQAFLQQRQVDHQEPCRTCWARYLCGGGCHAEVAEIGRDNCDMVRGWLDYCLRLYPRLLREFPTLLPTTTSAAWGTRTHE